jgi:hypothetical protein
VIGRQKEAMGINKQFEEGRSSGSFFYRLEEEAEREREQKKKKKKTERITNQLIGLIVSSRIVLRIAVLGIQLRHRAECENRFFANFWRVFGSSHHTKSQQHST